MKVRAGGGIVLTAFLLAGPAGAQPANCSRDVLSVDGAAVEVVLCATAPVSSRRGEGNPVQITVSETFSANEASFSRTVALDFLDSGETSRTIDDVGLQKLGIVKSLHLSIGYRRGSVRLEHAMLVPGAISLK